MATGFLVGGRSSTSVTIPAIIPASSWTGNVGSNPPPVQDYTQQGLGCINNAIGHCDQNPYVWANDDNLVVTIGAGTTDPSWISKVVFYLHGTTVTINHQTLSPTTGAAGWAINPQSGITNGLALLTWDIYPVNGFVRRGQIYLTLNSNPTGSLYINRQSLYVDSTNGSDSNTGTTYYNGPGFGGSVGPYKTIFMALLQCQASTIYDGANIYVEPNKTYIEDYNALNCANFTPVVANINTLMVNVQSRISSQNYTITRTNRVLTAAHISTCTTTGNVASIVGGFASTGANFTSVSGSTMTTGSTNAALVGGNTLSFSGLSKAPTLGSVVSGLGILYGARVISSTINSVTFSGPPMWVQSGTTITFIPFYSFNNLIANPNTGEYRNLYTAFSNSFADLDAPFALGNNGNGQTLVASSSTSSGNVINFSSTAGIITGMSVWGSGITPGTTVVSSTSTSITLSASVIGTGVAIGQQVIIGGDLVSLVGWQTNSSQLTFPVNKLNIDGAIFAMNRISYLKCFTLFLNSYLTYGSMLMLTNCQLIDANGYAGPCNFKYAIDAQGNNIGSYLSPVDGNPGTGYYYPNSINDSMFIEAPSECFSTNTVINIAAPNPISMVATSISTSGTNIINVANTYQLASPGCRVYGNNIPNPSYISTTGFSTTSFQLSTTATGTTASNLTGNLNSGDLIFIDPVTPVDFIGVGESTLQTIISAGMILARNLTITEPWDSQYVKANDCRIFNSAVTIPLPCYGRQHRDKVLTLTSVSTTYDRHSFSPNASAASGASYITFSAITTYNTFYQTYTGSTSTGMAIAATLSGEILNTVTSVSSGNSLVFNSTSGLVVGEIIVGINIPVGTLISSLPDGITVVMSNNITGTIINGSSIIFSPFPTGTFVAMVNSTTKAIIPSQPLLCAITSSTVITFTFALSLLTFSGAININPSTYAIQDFDFHFMSGACSSGSLDPLDNGFSYNTNYTGGVRSGDFHVLESLDYPVNEIYVVGDCSAALPGDTGVYWFALHSDVFQTQGLENYNQPISNIYFQKYKCISPYAQAFFVDQGQGADAQIQTASGTLTTSGTNATFSVANAVNVNDYVMTAGAGLVVATTSASSSGTNILYFTDTDGICMGATVSGIGITSGSTVVNIISGTSVAVSFVLTGVASGASITFGSGTQQAYVVSISQTTPTTIAVLSQNFVPSASNSTWTRESGMIVSGNSVTVSSPWGNNGISSTTGYTTTGGLNMFNFQPGDYIQIASGSDRLSWSRAISVGSSTTTTLAYNFINVATGLYVNELTPVRWSQGKTLKDVIWINCITDRTTPNNSQGQVQCPLQNFGMIQCTFNPSYTGLTTTTNGSAANGTNILPLTNTNNLWIGANVTGTNIPSSCTVAYINPGVSVVLNELLTSTVASGTTIYFAGQPAQFTFIAKGGGALATSPAGSSAFAVENFCIFDSVISGISAEYITTPLQASNFDAPQIPWYGFDMKNNAVLYGVSSPSQTGSVAVYTTCNIETVIGSTDYNSNGFYTNATNGVTFSTSNYKLSGISINMAGINGTGIPRMLWRYDNSPIVGTANYSGAL